jgi:hypothetical protein
MQKPYREFCREAKLCMSASTIECRCRWQYWELSVDSSSQLQSMLHHLCVITNAYKIHKILTETSKQVYSCIPHRDTLIVSISILEIWKHYYVVQYEYGYLSSNKTVLSYRPGRLLGVFLWLCYLGIRDNDTKYPSWRIGKIYWLWVQYLSILGWNTGRAMLQCLHDPTLSGQKTV